MLKYLSAIFAQIGVIWMKLNLKTNINDIDNLPSYFQRRNVKNILIWAVGAIGFIGSVVTIIGYTYDKTTRLSFAISMFCCLFAFVICLGWVISMWAEIFPTKLLQFVIGYKDTCHVIRDEFDFFVCSGTKTKQDTYNVAIRNFQKVLDRVVDTIRKVTNLEVYCCIKIFDFNKTNNINIDKNKWELTTFCRSSNSPFRRGKPDKKAMVQLNTDFEYIMNGIDVFFCSYDLYSLQKLGEYNNSSKDWKQYYRTTMVVPIRILKKESIDKEYYDILGFLCIDSKSTSLFKGIIGKCIQNYIIAVADSLYMFLNRVSEQYNNAQDKVG